jgi:hypothetical protein|tara:strand:- start:1450 stop:1902 length:453 start_codon:yes stop_codon:yes gene_type:complete
MISEGRRAPDLGMPTQAGNNLLWGLTRKAKTKRELLSMIDKLALKMGGKYKDAKDELITRAAIEAFETKGNVGHLANPDRNVMNQMKGIVDLGRGEIILHDKTKVKMDRRTATKVLKNLMNLKPQERGQALIAMQKSKSGFDKFFKLLNR